MKKPGFSRARERPFKLGPATTVASVKVARSLRSPALKAREPTPVVLSASYLPLREAFIVKESFGVGESGEREGDDKNTGHIFSAACSSLARANWYVRSFSSLASL